MTAVDWLIVGGSVVGILGLVGVAAALGAASQQQAPAAPVISPPTPPAPVVVVNPAPAAPAAPAAPFAVNVSSPLPAPVPAPAPTPAPVAPYAATDECDDTIAQNLYLIAAPAIYNFSNPSSPITGSEGINTVTLAFQTKLSALAAPPLRTDGTLDWRTWAVAIVAAFQGNLINATSAPDLITLVTNPGETGLAQAALPHITIGSTNATAAGITTIGTTLSQVVTQIQTKSAAINGPIASVSGNLDYISLALLIQLGFNT
jgi:hypothetical protein